MLKKSEFVLKKEYLWEISLHYFILKNSVAEAHRILVETYSHYTLSKKTCQGFFRSFKNNGFDVEDKEHSSVPKKF